MIRRRYAVSMSLFLVLVVFFANLAMPPVNAAAPFVQTLPATNITSTSAVLWMRVNPNGLSTSWKIFFARAGVPFTASTYACASTETGSVTVSRSCSLSGLTPSATYHFQAAATNADGTNYGAELTFTTLGSTAATGPPTVVTLEPGVGSNQAVFFGTINPNGLETEWQFWYGLAAMAPAMTMPSPGSSCEGTLPATTLVKPVSCTMTGLTPSTAYHVQLLAHNSVTPPDATGYAVVRGADIPFTTLAATTGGASATMTTLPPEILSPTSVRLNGEVNPNGSPIDWKFALCKVVRASCSEVVETPSPTCSGSLPAGTASVRESCVVTDLTPGTEYSTWIHGPYNAEGDSIHGEFIDFATPPATGGSAAHTDWAVLSVGLNPPASQIGTAVTFSMSMTLLSTIDPLPQSVQVSCALDGTSCGSGAVTIPGPTGQTFNVHTDPWTATSGTHVLTWTVSTDNDPHPENNVGSMTFAVQSSSAVQTSGTTTQPLPTTSVQTTVVIQTVTSSTQTTSTPPSISPTETSQQTITLTSELLGGAMEMIQHNSLLVISTLGLLVLLLAILALRSRKGAPPPRTNPARMKMSGRASKMLCPHCGASNPPTSDFCGKCGEELA